MFLFMGYASGLRQRLFSTYVASAPEVARPMTKGERVFMASIGALMYMLALATLFHPFVPSAWRLPLELAAVIGGSAFIGVGVGHYKWLI